MKKEKTALETTPVGRPRTPFDLWRLMGGKTERVRGLAGSSRTEALLAAYRDRVTYTFIFEREVASIHFDATKREIFFKGHNIKNLELTKLQKSALVDFKEVLKGDSRAKCFLEGYEATLQSILADNY